MPRLSQHNQHLRWIMLCLCAYGLTLVACEGETIKGDLMGVTAPTGAVPVSNGGDPDDPDDPPPAGVDGGEDGGAGVMMIIAGMPGGAGGEPPPRPMEVCREEPNVEAFAASVGPRLITSCGGGGCHSYDSNLPPRFPASVQDFRSPPLTTEQAQDMIDAFTPTYLVTGEADESDIYTYGLASANHYAQNNYSDELSEWIDSMKVCETIYPEEPEPTPVGGTEVMGGMTPPPPPPPPNPTEVFCSALPSGDPQGRPGFYETFRDSVNNILVYSCGASGCHGQPYPGYSFWIIDSSDPCSVQANFIMAQLYANFNRPLNSPLLTFPIDPEHGGGGRVFPDGNSDPSYNAIYDWIVLGQQ